MKFKNNFAPVPHQLGLYPVVDSLLWLKRMLDTGITTIQLRLKDKAEKQLASNIKDAVLLGLNYSAKIFINDHWKLAIRYNAYGVHLGQEDMNHANPDAIWHAGLRLGLSTHNEEELLRALRWNPSYIALGHIFATTTKKMPSQPQGLKKLKNITSTLTHIPTVAIGGITLDRVDQVLACGVGSIAVVSAITSAEDWRTATLCLKQKIEGYRSYFR
ncbi:Thiamine-phosphate synthase (plasmid) [Candidatus Erwinia haradaeae]|uniref:Thiamine-phosphate synthase n=1 Tax=Candidatus Erwinia haradaeae TaxID=1922217 RepID=A0A451DDT7_9GAMM|nr:thiamine phosphate synthase [Candidatus Erwinia haradaeae]VFP84640.1 Thiamine-phosphate synthase [Candidatus Erwinia haradaeae]